MNRDEIIALLERLKKEHPERYRAFIALLKSITK